MSEHEQSQQSPQDDEEKEVITQVVSNPSQHGHNVDLEGQVEDQDRVQRMPSTASSSATAYSVFTPNQKRFIVFMASFAGFFSPVSGQIYFPALNELASDLKVSNTLINLTLTSYMIFQGLAPTLIGDLADTMGRRPAYLVCFIIYIAANIGLALQNSYAALFVLRCLQSSGSSGTIAMASGVVSDIATAGERGTYIGFTLAGALLGPAIGPVIGGLLTQYLGWRSVFWFLTIAAAVFLIIFALFFPETARSQVGNGSVPPQSRYNMSLINYLATRRSLPPAARTGPGNDAGVSEPKTKKPKLRFPNPLASLHILWDIENASLLAYNALLFAAFYDLTAAIPSQFYRIYHFNSLHIGLCYLPAGVGSMAAALTSGLMLDRNFARWCGHLNIGIGPSKKLSKQEMRLLRDFPYEKARLQVAIPAAYVSAALVLIFGLVLDSHTRDPPLAVLLIIMFLSTFSMGVAFNVTTTLLVDFYPKSTATATAANNLFRCLLGAAATAAIVPMIDSRLGCGGSFGIISGLLVLASPLLWLIYWRGQGWRERRERRQQLQQQQKEPKEQPQPQPQQSDR